MVPAGIEEAGGKVTHFGMPVDPGNLLLTAELDGKPVLGLPGCAKSPKYNGFDMVLERLAAGLPVGRAEIVRMGAGGLLAEIPTRPQPRDDDATEDEGPQQAPRVAVLVLAAGRSTRMGGPNKMLADANGQPLVVHAVEGGARLAGGRGRRRARVTWPTRCGPPSRRPCRPSRACAS